ncbi:helix-turn-helix domain-containing protein [Ottowia sp. VDI28]|uniref:helix-turn-helix domain-containing protein n=1 Tax=Ottowia sp. VDI28 TaxID=3133968 RepID=UPI003C2D6E67
MLKQVATEFILNHIHDTSLKSSDVASSMEVSLRRLNAVFEASDGISVFEFIRQERMRRAALMLGQSTLGIADISIEVGYANPANFATEFRKFWGKSPTQLRSESQVNPDSLQQLISVKFN